MKKFLIITMLFCLANCLAGCSDVGYNKDIIDTVYSYDKALCYGDFDNDGTPEWASFEIDSWKDYEGEQVQIKTKDGMIYLFNSMNCTLIKSK